MDKTSPLKKQWALSKTDILGRAEIERLINSFYTKAMADEEIGFFFTKVAKLNLEEHLPVMHNFWESTLFHSANYSGNPMRVHINLNEKARIRDRHFERWLALFNETVDELYTGTVAELAKTRALSIATVMRIKLIKNSQHQ